MDVKLKSEIDFERYYRNEYNEVISKYYEMQKSKKISSTLLYIFIGIAINVIYFIGRDAINLEVFLGEYYQIVNLIYLISTILIVLNAIRKMLKNTVLDLNQYIITDLIAFISNNELDKVQFEPKKQLSADSLNKIELFNLDIVEYRGKNYISVPYYNNSMVFSDIETYIYEISESKKVIYKNGKKYLRTTRTKKKKGIFHGLYLGATLNKKNSDHIYLIPNNLNDRILQSKIMSYIKYHGVPVMLENLEFSKKYKVFCDDEIQARYILSLSFMEKINEIDKLFKGKKYIVFKEGKRFAICIEGTSIEQIRKKQLPVFRNRSRELKLLTNMFNQLNELFKIYHILDLGNSLYITKNKN